MDISVQAPVDLKLKVNSNFFGVGPGGEQPYVAISATHGLCQVYCDVIQPDGSRYFHHIMGPYAFRETDNGIQYYDSYSWKYFDKMTQELYCGYLAEKELLDE